MIKYVHGNLLESDANVLVNTVNCRGIMGAGIAKQFKQKFPEMFQEYKLACRRDKLQCGGDIWSYTFIEMFELKTILCIATKENWMFPSKIEWVERGLQNFVKWADRCAIKTAAFPKLGCNNGKLNWENEVKPLMEKYLEPIETICYVYV